MKSALASAFHLLALALGLGALFLRGRNLKAPLDKQGILRVLAADNLWGIAALLWITTGLLRAFGGLEKGTSFYLTNHMFHTKMGLFLIMGLLETWPMITFIRWRIDLKKGRDPDLSNVPRFARINDIELAVVISMVFVASLMARGVFM
jgi:putative membrane protein